MAFRGGDDTTFAADPVGLDISVGPLRPSANDQSSSRFAKDGHDNLVILSGNEKPKLIQIFDERVACIWEMTKPRGSVLAYCSSVNAMRKRRGVDSSFDRTPRWNMAHILDGHIVRDPLCSSMSPSSRSVRRHVSIHVLTRETFELCEFDIFAYGTYLWLIVRARLRGPREQRVSG